MRNYFIYFIFILTLLSCNNEPNDACNCQSNDYNFINLKIGGSLHQLKQFSDNNINFDFIYKNFESNEINVKNILSDFGITNINLEDVISLTFYIENGFNNLEENQTLNFNNVKSILIYGKDEKSEILTTFVYVKNSKFELFKEAQLKSMIISSNDIFLISKSLLNLKNVSAVSFIDFSKIPKNNSIVTELQDVLKAKSNNKGMESYCNVPCNSTPDGWCTASESQSGGERWWCLGDPRACGVAELEQSFSKFIKSDYNFNVFKIKDELYLFRDGYLLDKKGGQQIVEKYYSLSKNIVPQNVTYDYSVETFEILETIIPLLIDLRVNKNSVTHILIDNTTSIKLINQLDKSKKLFNDNQSLNTIEDLKSLISDFTNKPNSYISLTLDNYVFEK